MPEQTDIYISSFPDAESITNADKVTGLQGNANKNFTFSSILAWFVNAVKSAFVPVSRTINGKTLGANITLTATDVGARPNTWTPSAADVGARPDTWVPDAEDVPYDNTQSGLMATDVQNAIDEIAQGGGGGGGTAASAVSYDNTQSGLAATNVQDAIDEVYGDIPSQASDIGAQDEITANGILKGDGQGGVTAATPGTDYGTYSKPSGGIPASDLASGVIPSVPSAYTSNPAMDGTASPGSSGAWARGDHVHPSDTSKANQTQLAKVIGSPAGVNVLTDDYVIYEGQLYKSRGSFSESAYPATYLSWIDPITIGGLNDVNKILETTIELPFSTVGSSITQTARLIGQCTTLFGIPASKILSLNAADAALSPASVMIFGVYADGLYVAATQSCTLNSSVKVRIIYTK